MKSWKCTILSPQESLLAAISCLNESAWKIVVVANHNMELLGVLTDGDIRRAILKSSPLNTPISSIMNNTPTVVSTKMSFEVVAEIMRSKLISRIPIVDANNKVVGIYTLEEMLHSKHHLNPVVIMAGGLGSRLSPLTDETPKPLLKVGGKPILEIILSNCIQNGFSNFHFSINYRGEMIKQYFGDGSKWGVQISYIEETKQLGTAGALGLTSNTLNDMPVIVLNGDLLTNVDLNKMLEFHTNNDSQATMGVKQYDIEVPYGVVCTQDEKITSIKEKPVHSFLVNAGVYIINHSAIKFIPEDSKYNMTDLFQDMLEKNIKTAAFPIHEYWLDIGKIQDFERAQIDVQKIF